ncbi:hypothetical protein Tco_0637709, partial [Tanacetum coccineum]
MAPCLTISLDMASLIHWAVTYLHGQERVLGCRWYSLTISPTIYASYIEQFWATAKSKIVNNETQIHAKVDGKTIVISESSVRSNLHFNDEDVEGEGSEQPYEPQPPPSTAHPSQEGQVSAVGDEVVHKELGDRVERAATTAASLDAEQDSGNILKTQSTTIPNVPLSQEIGTGGGNTPRSDEERLEQHELMDNVPPTPHDSPLLGGHTPRSHEGRPNINELMAICINLSNKVLTLETSKSAQGLVINKLKKKVKRLEKKQRARTSGMKLFKIGTSKRKSLEKENVSKQGRNLKTRPMFEEGDFDDDFDDIDDMVNEATENVKRDTVNTGTTRVSAASASVTTGDVSISIAEPRTPPTTTTTAFEDEDLT